MHMAQNLKDTKEWKVSQLFPLSSRQLLVGDLSQFNQFLTDDCFGDFLSSVIKFSSAKIISYAHVF